ncbi:MAG: sigma-70 family RNA polymerase sigma factor [Phycisphaerae bacterium]|jgi:RNA polymerase sigma-70 factor (ECF subfamily)|nr:sigma-70 family RNA polymerase sigma factor [Phycisphaerae bacterium]MCZ2399403.1 sigma-70 family RNA polymerase sigma factor [Phycisphaerae bacterium]NUQ49298.1 sigma-70 family RNA polymerase sigma factor [Phycisphaerae bacterium]
MTRQDETRLIRRAQRGSAEAFRELVELYKERLFAFVWRLLRNHHEAEDVCQATFLKAYESLRSYSEKYAFSTWLFTIGYRVSLNVLRKRRTVAGDVDQFQVRAVEEEAGAELASSEEASRLRTVIWEAVDELTPSQKSAVLLFYREGKSCQEIGRVMGMPAVTVKSHLHRARERLRTVFKRELLDEWDGLDTAGVSRSG